jgi:putative transposase
MTGFSLRKGMVFDWNGSAFRIERLQPNNDLLLERLDNAQISIQTSDQLLSEYSRGCIHVYPAKATTRSVPVFSRPLDELSEAIRRELQRRQHYVQAYLDTPGAVFALVRPLIKQVAIRIGDESPPSATTLYRWTSRYRATKDWRSLIPRSDLRGRRARKLSPTVVQLATESIEEAFKASPRATCNNIYVRLIGKIDELNRRNPTLDHIKRPSERTLYRLINDLDELDKSILRDGIRRAKNKFRIAKAGTRSLNILERVEIDHTPLDLFIIDELSWLPLGRPTLTVVIDHHSRMLLGYYLSFGNPSVTAVMGALRHAILPKQPIQEAIPGLTIHHAWKCYGLPRQLVLDNGLEFLSVDLESVAYDLGFHLQFCPKKQPWFKGVVERYLKTINYFFAHQLPGTSTARLHLRGDYDPQKHAVLTLAEFKHVFEKWVLDVYSQSVHKGIATTPWAKWTEGLVRTDPVLPEDIHVLKRRIGHVTERSLRRDGIHLNGIRYNDDSTVPILRAYGEGVKVRVVSDSEDLGEIQIWGPHDQIPIRVRAINYEYASGLTQLQNDLIQTKIREEGLAATNQENLQQAKHDLVQAVQQLMISRKQKNRRTAASIRAMSSAKPHADFLNTSSATKPTKIVKLRQKTNQSNQMPTPAYGSFQLDQKPGMQ